LIGDVANAALGKVNVADGPFATSRATPFAFPINKNPSLIPVVGIGRAVWHATGRINVLHRASDDTLDTLAANGLREVALGIESGSDRMLTLIDKRIDPGMTEQVVRRLTERGIHVKGYFILGFPTETAEEIDQTVALVERLWHLTDTQPGRFWASVFEYRPYPGHPGLAPSDGDRALYQ
jgi:hypothetical protein